MTENNILGLTEIEKKDLLDSLEYLRGNLDVLVEKFYQNFLKTKAGVLFKNTDLDKQMIMFHSSIAVIITHIEHPYMLQEHLNRTITKHTHYGVISTYIDDFIESFYKALKEVFPTDTDKNRVELWYKLISSVMLYFKNEIH